MKHYFPYFLRICRGAALYLVFSLVSLCSLIFFVPDGGAELETELRILPGLIGTLFIPFAFDIAVRIFSENDPLLHSENTFCGGTPKSFMENARFVLSQKEFYIEVATLCVVCLLLPLETAFFAPMKLFFAESGFPRALCKLLIMLVICPLFFLIDFLGWYFSLNAWQQKQFLEPPKQWHLRILLGFFAAMALASFGFFVFSYLSGVFITIYYGFKGREWLYATIPTVIIAILLFCAMFRGVWVRSRYLRILKRRCRDAGFRVSHIRRPFLSLLFPRQEISFTVCDSNKTYACKLIGCLQKDCALFFSEEGIYYCQHALRFRKKPFFQYITSYSFAFKSEHPKVLIVNPISRNIYAGTPEFNRLIFTGETVGDYKIFEGIPFLNALERDCVERDPNRPREKNE